MDPEERHKKARAHHALRAVLAIAVSGTQRLGAGVELKP